MEAEEVAERLIGAWSLEEWSEQRPDGTKAYPLGEDAIGQILYSADGHMAAQLVRKARPMFRSADWREASGDEAASAFLGYFGYFGAYSIDPDAHVVTHHIEGAWFPNLEGRHQQREFRFDGERLVLDADTDWGRVRIVWVRP